MAAGLPVRLLAAAAAAAAAPDHFRPARASIDPAARHCACRMKTDGTAY